MKHHRILLPVLVILFLAAAAFEASAEEGMWTLDNLPAARLKARYGFTATREWIEHVRLASVRFNDGGSGSFVSPGGLVLTNHHVAVGQLQKMSSEKKDYVTDGYLARSPEEEIKCTDLELNMLVSTENVTERVKKSVKNLTGEKALKARKAEMALIEKESMNKTGLRSDVITLYHGGEYWLYAFRKYRDVRLVMAPEKQIAFYGGDLDNFTYPRYDLDFALFRVYEDGKPLHPKHYFKFNTNGGKDGELVFVSGHPGTTKRLLTYSQYLFNRDHSYPAILTWLDGSLKTLDKYSAKGPEEKRRAATLRFSYGNSQKALAGEYEGLRERAFSEDFKAREDRLRSTVNASAALRKEAGASWEQIAAAMKKYGQRYDHERYQALKGHRLPAIATQVVFFIMETKKPDGERLNGYHDSQIDTWKFVNLSPEPLYDDLEEALLAFNMELSRKKLGEADPFVKVLLGGKTPQVRARELVRDTKLKDPSYRWSLIEGGEKALKNSDDPLVRLALALEPKLREFIKWREANIESVVTPATENIAKARFAIEGRTTYPDATFTLRLAYGTIKGYEMNGTLAPPVTTIYGLYDRFYSFSGKMDFWLPPRYLEKKDSLDLATPFNFVSTADITGGNSGSPVITRDAELVGLIFDGNMESLAGRFIFSDKTNRAVAVHAAAIIEALRKLYDAGPLADELQGK
ncbi:MAG: S46 family peptidase [Candidatus Eremiobacteraeota bacterium]|nr:S46 family peptidase [Candidatus Eremiobacteraeota bacterium]